MIKVLTTKIHADGCSWYRTRQPLTQARELDLLTFKELDTDNQTEKEIYELIKLTDVYYLRFSFVGAASFIKMIKENYPNKPIIFDTDDDYFNVNPLNDFYATVGTREVLADGKPLWVEGKKFDPYVNRKRMIDYEYCISHATVVTTTTEKLAQELRKFNDNVIVFPNSIDPLRFPKIKVEHDDLRLLWHGGACVDNKTEILTDSGFKLFKNLNKTDLVATLNPNTNEMVFNKPTRYIKEKYNGNLNVVDKNQVKFSITPNHKIYAKNISCGEYSLNTIDKFRDFRVKRDFKWKGTDIKYITIPSVSYSQTVLNGYYRIGKENHKRIEVVKKEIKIEIIDWLKFFGFWLAEGWTTKTEYKDAKDGKTRKLMQVGLAQVKSNKILEEMIYIFKKYGLNFKYNKKGDQIRCCNKQLWTYLYKFGGSHEKYIPKEILNLPKDKLKILFDYYVKGDGCIDNNRIRTYSVSKELSDDFMEVGAKLGYMVNITSRVKDGGLIRGRKILSPNKQYIVSYLSGGKHSDFSKPVVYKKDIKQISYNGYVYCVDVPNHIMFIRKDGVCHWTGNSHYPDLITVKSDLERLMNDYPTLNLYIYGQVFKGLFNNMDEKRLHFQGWIGADGHGFRLATVGADVAICPLVESEFNTNKSSIKFYESAALGIPTVAKNILPYSADIKHGRNGFLYTNDLYDQVKKLLDDKNLRNNISKQCHQWVIENRNLETIGKNFGEFINKLVQATSGFEIKENKPIKKFSIVIPTHNRLNLAKQTLESLKKNTPRDLYQLIVVDDDSTDGTREWLKTQDIDVLIENNSHSCGASKNKGVLASTCEYIYISDADMYFGEGWYKDLIKVYPRIPEMILGCVGHPFWKTLKTFKDGDIEIHITEQQPGNSWLINRDIWNKCGPLLEGVGAGVDDTEFCNRAKKLGIYVGHLNSPVYHCGLKRADGTPTYGADLQVDFPKGVITE